MGHTRATIFCQEATVRHIPDIPGWGFVFQRDGELAHRARDTVAFLERKVPWTSFLQHCGRRIQRIWTQSTIASGVYCRRRFTDPQ